MTFKKIKIGEREDGSPKILRIDKIIIPELEKVRKRVKEKDWDYTCIVSGLPSSGKSTLARGFARYFCKWFSIDYIAFTAEEFIDITNSCPKYSSVILDESFASLNTKITMSEDFIRIINHLQIIRQRNLFIFLCLPNFFDLAKGIAIFRASHLFVTYASEEGDRGFFLAFSRDGKRKLYVKGCKYMDYNAVRANFRARYAENNDILDINAYEKKKNEHRMQSNKQDLEKNKRMHSRDKILWKLYSDFKWKVTDLAILAEIDDKSVYKAIKKFKNNA